jgi:YidC/Oxa1 family membrane protein insertase
MDRKTLLAFALIAVVLILTPWYMDLVSPVQKTVAVREINSEKTQNKPGDRAPVETKAVVRSSPTSSVETQSFVVSNGLYTATVSNKNGGSFSKFVFEKYSKYDSSNLNIIDHYNSNNLLLDFVSLDGDEVSLGSNWDVVGSYFNVDATSKQKSVTFKTVYNNYVIKKRLTFYPNTYKIGLDVIFDQPDRFISRAQYSLLWPGGLPPTEKNLKDDYTHFQGYAYLGDELLDPSAKDGDPNEEKQTGNTRWTATKTKYFIAAIIPEDVGVGAVVRGIVDEKRPLFTTELRQNTSNSGRFDIYLGPLEYNRIMALGVDLEKTMSLGWAPIRPLGRLVTWSLSKMYAVIPNYGLVVIIFAFLVKILLNPLTKKQFSSTKKMQALQPQIKIIKEKFKNDPKKLNKAQTDLFKQEGVNPLGGCLPMLFQMPILIAFFTVFRSTIEFRGAPFFGWITDLSAPDTLMTVAGFPINILPFLMGITMFLQQKLMASPDSGGQQKMMMYFMNVFFLFLFYTFPSGLNLYYSVFNILSIVQQKYLTPNPTKKQTVVGKPPKKK